jgi:FkbM family methyltransferase
VLAAAVVGARCVSIEPVPATVASLRENLALNRIEPLVELHPCAVGDREGLVVMTADQDSTNRVVSDEANARSATVRVPLRTVDQLLAERAPFMLKIDVEGFEAATLRGAVRALAQPTLHACILETLGAGAGGAVRAADWEPSAMLLEHGFKPAAYDPWRRTLTPIEQLDTAGNTLFIRDRAELEARLLGARSFVALGQRV